MSLDGRRLLVLDVGVLSIGKLVAGQECYYQQQIAKGLDDYYAGRGEVSGRWLGAGAAGLGLSGNVEDGQLAPLIVGLDPRSGQPLREVETRVAALDLTFSAPKSVSVLFAVAPAEVARVLVECHEEAVETALAYLEDTAVFVRRGPDASRRFERTGGLVVAAYRHRMSRALDPQLHTHCVAANMASGPDGRWTALHHPSLYRAAQTAGYLYQAHLRARVHERLGLGWGPVHKGAAELADVDTGVLEEFSRRRHEMRRAAERDAGLRLDTKRGSEKVAVSTRDRKQYGVETHTWLDEVKARASEHGLDARRVATLVDRGRVRVMRGLLQRETPAQVRSLGDRLAGPDGLTEKNNTFDERAVLRAHAEAAEQGATIPALRLRAAAFARRSDVLDTRRAEMTTAELVGVERGLIAAAEGRAGEGSGRVNETTLRATLANREWGMTAEQSAVVRATVTSGHGVQVIEALAGTGKTYTAGVLADVYRRAGYRVLGVAPTGRAVRELADEAAIPSRTLASMVRRIASGIELPRRCVLILDEAGMAATRETATLLDAAYRARAKVVAIGDPGQLHSVQAGGWMRAVGRRIGVLKLSEVMRQRDEQERRALGSLHEGVPGGWLTWAREQGRVELGGEAATLDRALGEWSTAARQHGLREAVLIARSNETRGALNDRAREIVRGWGALGRERAYGPLRVAVGDRVICRRNDCAVDVDNGTRGTVRAVHRNKVIIETDARTVRELPAVYVAEHVEHAYALTGHGMQGGTVEWAAVVAVPHELTRGWSYTALSRARACTRLFVLDEGEAWSHHELARRDEHAPGERADKPTLEQLAARVARYMLTRDDEDLAVEQLPVPALDLVAGERHVDVRAGAIDEEAGADAAEPGVQAAPTTAELTSLSRRLDALRAQLTSLETPEFGRLQAAMRRERALLAHHDELAERLRVLPPRVKWKQDPYGVQRRGLEGAIAGVDLELVGLRAVRYQLEQEAGPFTALVAERANLRAEIARLEQRQARVRGELILDRAARPSIHLPNAARRALGNDRARVVETLLPAATERAGSLSADRLAKQLDAGEAALHALDTRAAARAARLEHQLREHRRLASEEDARARAVTNQARPLRWRHRAERRRLLDGAARLRLQADRHRVDVERIELELARLTATGRHPDQWLARYGQLAADGLAARVERQRRHEIELDRLAQDAALRPSSHIAELIGEHPGSEGKLIQTWRQLALALERHRMLYRIDVVSEGALGDPAHRTREEAARYRRDVVRLSREIALLRRERGLPPHLPVEISRAHPSQTPAPDL